MKQFNTEEGFYLIEFLVTLTLSLIITNIALSSFDKVKEIATKKEMAVIVSNIQMYEVVEGKLPSNLNKLGSYMSGDYKKDSFGANYTYSKSSRELCSVSIDSDSGAAGIQPYCKEF